MLILTRQLPKQSQEENALKSTTRFRPLSESLPK